MKRIRHKTLHAAVCLAFAGASQYSPPMALHSEDFPSQHMLGAQKEFFSLIAVQAGKPRSEKVSLLTFEGMLIEVSGHRGYLLVLGNRTESSQFSFFSLLFTLTASSDL